MIDCVKVQMKKKTLIRNAKKVTLFNPTFEEVFVLGVVFFLDNFFNYAISTKFFQYISKLKFKKN